MEKYKNYIIGLLILIIIVAGVLFGPKFSGSDKYKVERDRFRDSIAVIKTQKVELEKRVTALELDKSALSKSVDSVVAEQAKTSSYYESKISAIAKQTPRQLDSLITAEFPKAAASPADTTLICQPTWRVKEAEDKIVHGEEAIALNSELHTEIGFKDKIIVDDTRIISDLNKRDSLSTDLLNTTIAASDADKKELKREVRRQKLQKIGIVVSAVIIWTLTLMAK